jgi:hypothetical protein
MAACAGAPASPSPDASLPPAVGAQPRELHQLWRESAIYMRFDVVEHLAGLPQASATAARLGHVHAEIGAAMTDPHVGALLDLGVARARAVLDALASGDGRDLLVAKAAWTTASDMLARYLANIEPSVTYSQMRMLTGALEVDVLALATARLGHDWDGDVRASDALLADSTALADVLAGPAMPPSAWLVDAMWLRDVMVSPDRDGAELRHMQNPDVSGGGDAHHTTHAREHDELSLTLIDAGQTQDAAAFADAKARWYLNGGGLGLSRAALDATIEELADHLAGHYEQDLDDFAITLD